MMLAGAEIVEKGSVAFKTDEAGNSEAVISSGPSQSQVKGLAQVPTKEPVDIQFTNITCTVSLGINKGIVTMPYNRLFSPFDTLYFKSCSIAPIYRDVINTEIFF